MWTIMLSVFIIGMTSLVKAYELPKAEEVNTCKQKLERIHAEFATNLWVFVGKYKINDLALISRFKKHTKQIILRVLFSQVSNLVFCI